MAFIFTFCTFGSTVYAADIDSEIVEDTTTVEVTDTTTELEETTTVDVTTEDEKEFIFDIDEDTLKALEGMIGSLVSGEYKQAYDELKGIVGASLAVTIVSVFVALIFIIRNLRKNKILADALAKMDAQTQARINTTMDEIEKQLNDTVDVVKARMGQMDNDQKAKAQAEINALTDVITGAKAEINE